MFSQLSEKLTAAIKKLKNTGVIRESHIEEALREVRLALLSADVHVSVVKDFITRVKDKAIGQNIVGTNTAAQQFYKIVHDELIHTVSPEHKNLNFAGETPHVILLVGLQGSGKTTTAAKLALHFRQKGRRPFLLPMDFRRPAAVEQLKTLAKQVDIPVYDADVKQDPVQTVKLALDAARAHFYDLVLIDTAGRLHIDETLMAELKEMQKNLPQPLILFVADAMTGQEAVNVAKAFHSALNIDGIVLTKMDGDAKGGAALSIQAVAGCPIHFVGVGEKVAELEPFYPERLVSRLLDRGDILSLVEKAQEVVAEGEAERLVEKISKDKFDLEDFRQQLKTMKKLGSLSGLLKFIPGAQKLGKNVDLDKAEGELKRKEAIINSMTRRERQNPKLLNGSRRNRIALGSGVSIADINRFMKEFEQMKKMMKGFSQGGVGADLLKRFYGNRQ